MNRNTKLFSAALMLALSLVMLVGASLAWFTVSTAPEISGMQVTMYADLDLLISKTGEEGTFFQSVSTEKEDVPDDYASIDNFPFYAQLKPISTVNGTDWFRPKYKANGELEPVSQFLPSTLETHANVLMGTLSGEEENQKFTFYPETSYDYFTAYNNGYFVYADVWLTTENADGVAVTLSVPNLNSLQSWETGDESQFSQDHGKKYGTFALGKYEMVENAGEGQEKIAKVDNNVQTALRVGFLVDNQFYIWEPNADQRSDFTNKPKKSQLTEPDYIIGYQLEDDQSNYQEGQYIKTKPVAYGANNVITTTEIPTNRLLVQLKSEWDLTELAKEENVRNPNSNHVETFGKFFTSTQALYNALDSDGLASAETLGTVEQGLASSNILLTLQKDEVKQVRLFFWLEGQDVDCWNDIASGSFLVNLEFAAQPIPVTQTPGGGTEE